jgi:hypothetical protein
MGQRVTQNIVEVIGCNPDAPILATQLIYEVLQENALPQKITQVVSEALSATKNPHFITQTVFEILQAPVPMNLTQVVCEVIGCNPDAPINITQVVFEVIKSGGGGISLSLSQIISFW